VFSPPPTKPPPTNAQKDIFVLGHGPQTPPPQQIWGCWGWGKKVFVGGNPKNKPKKRDPSPQTPHKIPQKKNNPYPKPLENRTKKVTGQSLVSHKLNRVHTRGGGGGGAPSGVGFCFGHTGEPFVGGTPNKHNHLKQRWGVPSQKTQKRVRGKSNKENHNNTRKKKPPQPNNVGVPPPPPKKNCLTKNTHHKQIPKNKCFPPPFWYIGVFQLKNPPNNGFFLFLTKIYNKLFSDSLPSPSLFDFLH